MDEVDRIMASWAQELPGLDASPLASLSRLSRLSRHLDRARSEAFAAAELEPWEFDVLAALRRLGPPYEASPGELIHETLSTSGTMTNRINRLESRGLVVRLPNAQDRRGVLVRLTAKGPTTLARTSLVTVTAGGRATADFTLPPDPATVPGAGG